MWKIKDFIINSILSIRLFIYLKLNKKSIKNDIHKDGYELTFNDEFDIDLLNYDVWTTKSYYGLRFHPGNIIEFNKAPDMYYSDKMVKVKNGKLILSATDRITEIDYTDWNGVKYGKYLIPYQIGQIDSSKSFSQKYGYFEVRSKNTDQPGNWSSFWLASTESWPPEIDIYEMYKGINTMSSNFHWNENGKHKMSSKTHKINYTEFHTYAIDWSPSHFKIYYDNKLIRIYTNPKALKEFKYKMHIILANGVNVNDKDLINAKFPTKHIIDYIRVYKKIS